MKTTTLLKQVVVGVLTLISQLTYSNSKNESTFKKVEPVIIDSSVCLQLSGTMPKSKYSIKTTYTVELLHNNALIKSVKVNEGGDFNFQLNKNTWYAVRITGENSVPKIISINTNLPKRSEKYLHILSFNIDELINPSEAANLDNEALDFPMAIFCYDQRIDNFDYNQVYTKNIKKELLANLTGKPNLPNMYYGVDRTNSVGKK